MSVYSLFDKISIVVCIDMDVDKSDVPSSITYIQCTICLIRYRVHNN